ncbi:MAG: hypothetical protein J5825_03010 [Lachnospiraceae bacterium]|nr:hypothetical protein [Lachnospiraceae bacterium]
MNLINQLASVFARNYNYSYSSGNNGSGIEALFVGGMLIFYLIMIGVTLLLSLVIVVSMCKLAAKAGEPWWSQLIPFYNSYVYAKICFGNGWLFLCVFITLVPIIGYLCLFVFVYYQFYKLAIVFGKGIGTFLGLVFLPVIFFPMLAFGNSTYHPENADFFGKTF